MNKQQEILHMRGFTFQELLHSEGLSRLDQAFLLFLKKKDLESFHQLIRYREQGVAATTPEISELLIRCAIILEAFLADLFDIDEVLAISAIKTTSSNPLATFKKYFVLRRAKKEISKVDSFPDFETLNAWLMSAMQQLPLQSSDPELSVALLATQYLAEPEQHAAEIEKLVQWCTRALTSQDPAVVKIRQWSSFRIPQRLDHENLVPTTVISQGKHPLLAASEEQLRLRDGFKLTDERMNAREVQDEVNYCIYCHDHNGDFCSRGFPVKKGDPAQGFKKNPLDTILTGCPLEEKISEMNWLKQAGHTLASLAMIMVDNPMCPATGHRICNDCMKACIYQKQDPVNIPQIETRVLTDVLDLPWGVEIYDLLTRWNPLRHTQWVMKPFNGLKIMIAGMGPAGFTLAHHLLLEGCAVVGFDGLKIEPLPEQLLHQPVYRFADLKESLDERIMTGFGGVAEYGITVRWDKNFLKLIYLSLMRRPYFQVFGGVRFGGTMTVEDAFASGFDHFVIAVGAGLPRALSIPGSMATGMRQANDFLMALQLGNAAKASSLTSLQIRLPAVVIGGGLTGVDTATELQAYYIRQVEKILKRYEVLVKEYGEEVIQQQLDHPSRQILAEYLNHGKAVQKERERAKVAGNQPNFIRLAREWGGVTIVYRRSLKASPAYINNHEELKKALEEGIYYCEELEPLRVQLDEQGHVTSLVCRHAATAEEITLPARSILAATGTQPNTAYEFEHRGTFNRLNAQYQHYEDHDATLTLVEDVKHCKDPQFGPFTSYHKKDHRVSLIGDTHPVFHGNVVKAIASGLRTWPRIMQVLKNKLGQQGNDAEYQQFAQRMQDLFTARVYAIERKTSDVIELKIRAPLAARHFRAGQLYRLQNFETCAALVDQHTLLQMEPLALIAAECDYQQGILTFLINEKSATAKICSTLKVNEVVSLMGPTGVRAKIPTDPETVLIIGDVNSIAFLRSYGTEMRRAGHRVLYLGCFNSSDEIYCQTACEEAASQIIWLMKEGTPLNIRENDVIVSGTDFIETLVEKSATIGLGEVDRIYIVGEATLLRQFQCARNKVLKTFLPKNPKVFGSVHGNMQCMLKGVCAQCLQWQIDPETGQRTKAVYTCSWQDQPLEIIDMDHMQARQSQNHLLNQMNNLWIDHVFRTYDIGRI